MELDSVVRAVIHKFMDRARVGKQKYGTDLDRKDLKIGDWITHAQEELMDGILYLEKLKQEVPRKKCIACSGKCAVCVQDGCIDREPEAKEACYWCHGTLKEPTKPEWTCTRCHGDGYT